MTNTIYTDRLILRLFKDTDFEMYSKIMTNPLVTKYLGSGKNNTNNDVKRIISKFNSVWQDNDYGVWAVVDKNTQKIIGHCGFLPFENKIELLYAYNTTVWGKGYATEAALAVINYAKSNYDWSEIIAMAYPQNKASINVINKLGFKFESIIEEFNSKLNLYKLDLGE